MSNFELSDSQMYVGKELSPILSSQSEPFQVRFWGVRGLIPTPSTHNSRYGGNTGCVEMYVAGKRLVFDGGTGLRILGGTWQELNQSLEAHLFFTNSQSNRIQGFPFLHRHLSLVIVFIFMEQPLPMVHQLNNVCVTKCFSLTFLIPYK